MVDVIAMAVAEKEEYVLTVSLLMMMVVVDMPKYLVSGLNSFARIGCQLLVVAWLLMPCCVVGPEMAHSHLDMEE
jgi:hypothetical protein